MSQTAPNPRRRRTRRVRRRDRRAVRPARPGQRRAGDRHACRPHDHGLGDSGKITVVPDVARIYLGVTVTKPTVKAARRPVRKAMTDIIAALKALGIAEADIQTTNVSLYPQYGNGSAAKVVGYQISEQIEVTVRDLDKAGDVGRRGDREGRDQRQRHLVRARRPGQGPERRARRRGRRGPDVSAQAMATAGHVSLGAVVSITDATQSRRSTTATAGSRAAPRSRTSRPRSSRAPRT